MKITTRRRHTEAVTHEKRRTKPILESDHRWRKAEIGRILPGIENSRYRFILNRLLERPVTTHTAHGIFDLARERPTFIAAEINRLWKAQTGVEAIEITGYAERIRESGFWTLRLYTNRFEVPVNYTRLRVGTEIRMADVLNPHPCRVVEELTRRPWQTLDELRGKNAGQRRWVRPGEINAACKALGFPLALRCTRTLPALYALDSAFVRRFGLKVATCQRTVEELFAPHYSAMIRHLASCPHANAGEIQKTIGVGLENMHMKIRIVEQRCRELGLPEPFERIGKGAATEYRLTPDFRKRFGLGAKTEKTEDHFTEGQVKVIVLIARQPYISTLGIARELGMPLDTVYDRLEKIRKRCRAHALPKMQVQITTRGEKMYRWPSSFLKRFGLEEGPVEVARRLRGNQRRVYEYGQGKEVVYGAQVLRDLRMNQTQLRTARRELGRKLRQWRQPPLPRFFYGKARVGWDEVREWLIFHRMKNGRWPGLKEIRVRNHSVALGIVNHHGGMGKVMERVRTQMSPEEITHIINASLPGSEQVARQEIERAMANGVGIIRLMEILDEGGTWRVVRIIKANQQIRSDAPTSGSPYTNRRAVDVI